MQTLALHFDFSGEPQAPNIDMSCFRHDLAIRLERALQTSGGGRWKGGRYARGVVTIFLEVPDATSALQRISVLLADQGLTDRLTVSTDGPHRFV